MGILEKIAEIENEINRTQKNKGKCCLNFDLHEHTINEILYEKQPNTIWVY